MIKENYKVILPIAMILLWIFCFLTFPAYSDCAPSFSNCKFDTLGTDSFIVSVFGFSDTDLILIDTISKTSSLNEMQNLFDSSDYCFLGEIDSTIEFKDSTEDDGDTCTIYKLDSVHVNIDTVFKGQVPDSYWFIDTLFSEPCDTNEPIATNGHKPSYSSIKGNNFIAFTKVFGPLSKSNIVTSFCYGAQGYYVDQDGNIVKRGVIRVNLPGIYHIDTDCLWIKFPYKDFVDAIGQSYILPHIKRNNIRKKSSVIYSPIYKCIKIFTPKNQCMSITAFSIDGKKLINVLPEFTPNEDFSLIKLPEEISSKGIKLLRIEYDNYIQIVKLLIF